MQFKSFFSVITLLLILASCQKEDMTNPTMEPDPAPMDTTAMNNGGNSTAPIVLSMGTFTGQNGYPASGSAQIIRDNEQRHFVRLGADFKTSFATGSVTMYLSKNANLKLNDVASFAKLAVINTNGQHSFAITAEQSAGFQYVIVWCAPAGIQFGRAELK